MVERTELEDKYYKVRNDAIGHMDMFEREKLRAEIAVKTLNKLDVVHMDDVAEELVKMADDNLNHKLDAQRQTRRRVEAEEEVLHKSRLLENKTKELNFMEDKLAKLEKDMVKKEQLWRNQDNERQR
jgi:hypothetical protein